MGIKLNTPKDTAADGTLLVTWKPAATDPTMALVLDGPISVDIATGVVSAAGNTSVGLGNIPPGTYKLQAVVGDALETVLDTSGDFKILAAGAAPPPKNAPPAAPPVADGKIKLNTPKDTAADDTLLVTWTPGKDVPGMALVLDGPISVDIATGVAAAAGNTSVGLGNIPPGTYKLQAVVGDALETVIDTSGDFKILAAKGAAPPPKNAPPAAPPVADGKIKLNTPKDTAADDTLLVTWTPGKDVPTMALVLDGPISIDIATGVAAAAGNTSVGLGNIPPGTYKLQAVVGDALETVIDTSGDFKVLPAKAAGGAAPPPKGAAPVASGSAAPPAASATTGAGKGQTGKGQTGKGKTGKGQTGKGQTGKGQKGQGGKAAEAAKQAAKKAEAAKKAAKAKAAAAQAAGAKAAGAKAAGAKAAAPAVAAPATAKKGRMVSGAKFGRRELYRD
ncbi:hypothetical protein B0H14DRAFT_3496322 [Mycena olivaceomarginata]|nr:hypothetical protein B0H14DRAFT_3496322 [Mycena olivaceomarginata]